jgi:hypothetical protein
MQLPRVGPSYPQAFARSSVVGGPAGVAPAGGRVTGGTVRRGGRGGLGQAFERAVCRRGRGPARCASAWLLAALDARGRVRESPRSAGGVGGPPGDLGDAGTLALESVVELVEVVEVVGAAGWERPGWLDRRPWERPGWLDRRPWSGSRYGRRARRARWVGQADRRAVFLRNCDRTLLERMVWRSMDEALRGFVGVEAGKEGSAGCCAGRNGRQTPAPSSGRAFSAHETTRESERGGGSTRACGRCQTATLGLTATFP